LHSTTELFPLGEKSYLANVGMIVNIFLRYFLLRIKNQIGFEWMLF